MSVVFAAPTNLSADTRTLGHLSLCLPATDVVAIISSPTRPAGHAKLASLPATPRDILTHHGRAGLTGNPGGLFQHKARVAAFITGFMQREAGRKEGVRGGEVRGGK